MKIGKERTGGEVTKEKEEGLFLMFSIWHWRVSNSTISERDASLIVTYSLPGRGFWTLTLLSLLEKEVSSSSEIKNSPIPGLLSKMQAHTFLTWMWRGKESLVFIKVHFFFKARGNIWGLDTFLGSSPKSGEITAFQHLKFSSEAWHPRQQNRSITGGPAIQRRSSRVRGLSKAKYKQKTRRPVGSQWLAVEGKRFLCELLLTLPLWQESGSTRAPAGSEQAGIQDSGPFVGQKRQIEWGMEILSCSYCLCPISN